MIGNDDTEFRAVAAAVAGAADQARLESGVNMTGLLLDMGTADTPDVRRYFLCWQLTRSLAPSLAELVPSAVVREVRRATAPPPRPAPPEHSSHPAPHRADAAAEPKSSPEVSPPSDPGSKRLSWWWKAAFASAVGRWGSMQGRKPVMPRGTTTTGPATPTRANVHRWAGHEPPLRAMFPSRQSECDPLVDLPLWSQWRHWTHSTVDAEPVTLSTTGPAAEYGRTLTPLTPG